MAPNLPRQRGIETGQSGLSPALHCWLSALRSSRLALQPIPAEFATRRAAPVLAVSLTYVGSGVSGIAMGCLAGWFSMRPIAIGCGLMIALGLVVTSSGGLHQFCACNLVLLGLIGGAGMFSPTTPMSRVGSRRDPAVGVGLIGQSVATAVWPVLLQIGIDRYGWRRAMTLHGILIALAVPGLTGMIYSSPPDTGTASDAPGVDGIVKGPHFSAHPFKSAVPVSIGGPSWNT